MSAFEVYFYFVVLAGILNFMKFIIMISILLIVIFIFFCNFHISEINYPCNSKEIVNKHEEALKRTIKNIKISVICFIIGSLFIIVIPTQKEMAAIITIPAVTQNEKIQNIAGNGLDLINAKFVEWLEEVKK